MAIVQMPDGNRVQLPDNPTDEQRQQIRVMLTKAKERTTRAPIQKTGTVAAAEPQVDNDSGLPFTVKAALAQADNRKEELLLLGKVYGKENVKTMHDGLLAVMKDGKLIGVQGGSGLKNFAADVVGRSAELGGMGMGAALGAPAGPAGAVLGAAVGAMFGHAAQEIGKIASGRFDKSNEETVKASAKSGLEGVEGEVGGRLVTGGISRVLKGKIPSPLTGVTPESQAITARTTLAGARPNAVAALPSMKHIQFMEALAAKATGPSKGQQKANMEYLQKRMSKILAESGVPPSQLQPLIKELNSIDSKLSTEEIGDHIKKTIAAHEEMLGEQVTRALGTANSELSTAMQRVKAAAGRSEGLAVDAAEAVGKARRVFGEQFGWAYEKIDAALGGQPIIPTFGINAVARSIVDTAPNAAKPGIIRELANIGVDLEDGVIDYSKKDWAKHHGQLGAGLPSAVGSTTPKIKFADAQRIRTVLQQRLEEGNLIPNTQDHDFGRLVEAVDQAFELAAHDPAAAPAIQMLRKTDAAYREGIAKFKDTTIQGLVKDMKAGLPSDPEKVASRILQPGNEARVRTVRGLLGEEVWNKVRAADYSNIMRAAQDKTGAVDGMTLLHEVTRRGKMLDEVYGASTAKDLRELAAAMAVRDGGLPVEQLTPGVLKDTLTGLKAEQKQLDSWMKENALASLADPKRSPESAFRWLVHPENGRFLQEAEKLFGSDSAQMQGIRQAALKELLTHVKVSMASPQGVDALTTALNKFTPVQQKILFPNGMANDLHLLGKEVRFLVKDLGDEAKASFAAGAILATPAPARWVLQAPLALYQIVLSQPTMIRYLATGLRQLANGQQDIAKLRDTSPIPPGAR